MKHRMALLVYVDLDSDVDETEDEKAQDAMRIKVADILEERIDYCNPIVAHAPDSLQPRYGSAGGLPTAAEVREIQETIDTGEIPRVGSDQPFTGVLNASAIETIYTEGSINA